MDEITKLANEKREKMRIEIETEKKRLETTMKLEEQNKLAEMEKLLKQKEEKVNERLKKLEDEKKKEWEQVEEDIRRRLNDSVDVESTIEELKKEEIRLKETLREEERAMKAKVEELEEETNERKRRISDEDTVSRRDMEDERELKLKELVQKMEGERIQMEEEWKNELKHREEQFDKQCREKEEKLMKKIEDVERKKMEECNSTEDGIRKSVNKEYEERFQELERNYRRRENELEMQLADLREQQKQSQYKEKGVSPLPVVENFTELKQSNLEAEAPDGFDFEIPDGPSHLSNRTNISGRNALRSGRDSAPIGFNEHISDLQKELYSSKRQVDAYKEKASVLERVGREMQYDMEEMHKMIEVLNHSHKEKDKRSNDVELELQTIKYKLEKEIEEKTVAEKLCKQLRDQLDIIEAKLTSESDLRQSLYLESQKQQNDLESRDQKICKIETEMQELKLTMESERNAKSLQEDRYKEQIRQHELALMEVEKTSNSRADAVTKLEVSDESRRQAESTIQLLQVELAQTKAELSRTQSHLDEYKSSSDGELTKLREKLEDKTEQLGMVEKNLFQVQIQYENEKLNRSSLEEKLASKVQNDSSVLQRSEEEIIVLKQQLEKSKDEFLQLKDKFTSVDHERESVTLKMSSERVYLERDLAVVKEQLKVAEMKLSDAETQIKTMHDELRTAGVAVTEKSGDADNIRSVLQETKNNAAQMETNLREEKMLSNKLESKLEAANERISLLQAECDKLSKELMSVKEEYANRDRSAHEKQDSTNMHITTLKENFNQDIHEVNKDLSTEKTEKSMLNTEIEKIMRENSDLKASLENLRSQLKTVTNEKNELQIEATDLKLELDKSKEACAEMTQRVQKKMSEIESARLENHEVKTNLQEMKKLKFVVESDLREEKTRAESTHQDLMDANRARESLESLLANIKGNNVNLEERLNAEAFNRTQRDREIEEHKGLWESEIKSRSKIGLKVIELEKQIEDMKKEVDEEKRKARKAIDSKKSADDKNEMYEKRSLQHQQEVTALKNKLKQYQRRLKECEGNDSRIPTIRAEFDIERQAMSSNLTKLRRQLDQLSERLTHEQEMRDAEEKKNREQLKELTDLKTNEKVQAYEQERLERKCREFQQELERQKSYYERNFFPAEEIEEFKKALETKARLDLNKKLQEVNMHLEEQSLAREAFDKLRDGIEKKTKTGFEETVSQLKNDLTEVKACLHEGLVKRDTSLMEAHRFKELYESERVNSDKLSEQLVKTNDRLNLERNRTNYLFDETMNKSKVTKKLFEESLEKDKKNSLSPRLQDDLGGFSYYRPKLWSTPVASTSKSPYTSPDPVSSIKRRNLLS